jgi:UDP-N-acetylglucosamine 2-epimerase
MSVRRSGFEAERLGGVCLSDVRIVVGTRPQVIKLASLVKALDSEGVDYSIVHTGQHYDFEMDQVFFDELKLPKPEAHIGVGSGSHAYQTGTMVVKLEGALKDSQFVLVPGDTNSALAGGLAAAKMDIEVGHVEAGLRGHVSYLQEELNRVLVDHLSKLLFAPTVTGRDNLLKEGIDESKVHLTGDVMADNIVMLGDTIDKADPGIDLERKRFIYVTIHRAENVDDISKLKTLVEMLSAIPGRHGYDVVFPVHPHTKKRLDEAGLWERLDSAQSMHLMKPVSYLTSLKLARDAKLLMTDSGGLQKEAFILGTPSVTLKRATEWVETIEAGWNILAGVDPEKAERAVETLLRGPLKPVEPMKLYGEGKASQRIARLVKEQLA